MNLPGWGNGRDVTKLWEESKSNRDERVYDSKEQHKVITKTDVEMAVNAILKSRASKSKLNAKLLDPLSQLLQQKGYSHTPPVMRTETKSHSEEIPSSADSPKNNKNVVVEEKSKVEIRDEGVPDEVWQEIQAAKEVEMKRQKELEELMKEVARQEEEERLARIRYEEEMERIRLIKVIEEQERRRLETIERKRLEEIEIERQKIEQEKQRLIEKERQRQEIQTRLRQIGKCPMGFDWYKCGSGWRCSAGGHFVSDEQLKQQFGYDGPSSDPNCRIC